MRHIRFGGEIGILIGWDYILTIQTGTVDHDVHAGQEDESS